MPTEQSIRLARELHEELGIAIGAGCRMVIASGTDEVFVRQEAEWLDVARYFGRHIYGAQDNYQTFSKKIVIDRIALHGEVIRDLGGGFLGTAAQTEQGEEQTTYRQFEAAGRLGRQIEDNQRQQDDQA